MEPKQHNGPQSMQQHLRLAMYSQDGLGLGHLRRSTLIAEKFLEQTPNGTVLLMADSPVAPFFKLSEGMDHLKLPAIRKINHGHWEAAGLRIEEQLLRAMRADILRETLIDYQPQLLLVDHMPLGAQGEMLPAIQALRSKCPNCRIVLGLRDILDAQDVSTRVWETESAYDAVRRYYDGILIYGSPEVFDTRDAYRLPEPPCGIHYCGYVANHGSLQPRSELPETGAANQPFVFVSAGGGADGHPLMEAYVGAMRLLGRAADFTSVMAVGANATVDVYRRIREQALGLPIRVIPYTDNSISYLAAADLVVCMAGYNTLSEVLYLRKKALVVPRPGPSAEQRMRASLFSSRGLVDMMDPACLTPGTLAARLLADLQRTDYPVADDAFRMCGAEQAATHLLQFLE